MNSHDIIHTHRTSSVLSTISTLILKCHVSITCAIRLHSYCTVTACVVVGNKSPTEAAILSKYYNRASMLRLHSHFTTPRMEEKDERPPRLACIPCSIHVPDDILRAAVNHRSNEIGGEHDSESSTAGRHS